MNLVSGVQELFVSVSKFNRKSAFFCIYCSLYSRIEFKFEFNILFDLRTLENENRSHLHMEIWEMVFMVKLWISFSHSAENSMENLSESYGIIIQIR